RDPQSFPGFPLPLTDSERAKRHRDVRASCVVEIDAISPESASQIESALKAFAHRSEVGEEEVRVEAIYDQDIGHLKVMLFGGAAGAASALMLTVALLKKGCMQPSTESTEAAPQVVRRAHVTGVVHLDGIDRPTVDRSAQVVRDFAAAC